MEERYLKFEDLMADLAAYLVSEYDIEPRDAAWLVMNSPLTQELYSSEEPITDPKVKALAEKLLASDNLWLFLWLKELLEPIILVFYSICTIFDLRSKVLTFLRPDGSKRQAEREKTQKSFGFLLSYSYLCSRNRFTLGWLKGNRVEIPSSPAAVSCLLSTDKMSLRLSGRRLLPGGKSEDLPIAKEEPSFAWAIQSVGWARPNGQDLPVLVESVECLWG